MQIAASALDDIEMVNLATPVLEELSRATGESHHFAVCVGDAVVVVARTGVPGALQLADRVGLMRPAHCLASLTDASAATVYRARAELTQWTQKIDYQSRARSSARSGARRRHRL